MKFTKKEKIFLTICAIAEAFLVPAFIITVIDSDNQVHADSTQAEEATSLSPGLKDIGDGTYEIKYPFVGDAGAITIPETGYTVAVYDRTFDSYDVMQAVIDKDYSALLSSECLLDDDLQCTDAIITTIYDHDYGTPAAYPATSKGDVLFYKDGNGWLHKYVKVAQFATGNRDTNDFYTEAGIYVFNEQFIRQFGNPSNMIMFVTCHNDGRMVSLWKFDGNVSASENFVKTD